MITIRNIVGTVGNTVCFLKIFHDRVISHNCRCTQWNSPCYLPRRHREGVAVELCSFFKLVAKWGGW